MAAIDISSTAAPLNDGVLQLQNGVAMDSTLRNVADQNDTTSPLKLSTTAVQVVSPLRITTDDPSDMYLDCEDGATNNRFNITRNTASQQVNLNFASNPAGSTTIVGAIRTYVDGVNLSEVMTFREDGNVGFGTTSPTNAVSIERTTGNAILSLQGNAGTFISISRFSDNSTRPRLELYKSRGTISTPAVIQTNDELGSVDFYGYDGSANQRVGILYVNAESVVGSTITPQMAFGLGTSAAANTYKMVVKNDGNVTIGNSLTTLGARLGIKGSGSTSATTALLVQNSNGNKLFEILDSQIANAFMYSFPMTNNGGLTLKSNVGTTETPALFLRPNTGLNGANIYVLDNKIYFRLINTNEVGSDSVYVFATDNRKAKLGVSPDDSTYDSSIYTKAIWEGGVAGHFRSFSAAQYANVLEVANYDNSQNYINVSANGNLRIGNGAVDTARTSIKGSGSTSATTSLLVQNSSGSQIFKIDDTGTISVPLSGSGVYRDVLVNNNGSAIIGSRSNDYLYFAAGYAQVFLFSTAYLYLQSPYLRGNATQGSNASAFTYVIDINAYGNTSLPLKFNNYTGNVTFQNSGSAIIHNTEATLNFDTGGGGPRTLRAYYYNPTFVSGPQSYDKHYAWQNTLGAMIVNSSTPQDSAILQADSTTQGFLPPRMTNAQRAAITTPAIGLMVYCTDAVEGIYVYKSTGWTFVA